MSPLIYSHPPAWQLHLKGLCNHLAQGFNTGNWVKVSWWLVLNLCHKPIWWNCGGVQRSGWGGVEHSAMFFFPGNILQNGDLFFKLAKKVFFEFF
jgi:hypothetical protein